MDNARSGRPERYIATLSPPRRQQHDALVETGETRAATSPRLLTRTSVCARHVLRAEREFSCVPQVTP